MPPHNRPEPFLMSVVVPVYNEERGIEPFLARAERTMTDNAWEYEILFCMDPSSDATEEVIRRNMARNRRIKLIKMSRRFGQPAATLSGIHRAKGDVCVVIDVDLQDPPELIVKMVDAWREGYDVAYAQRTKREGENPIRMVIVRVAYWLINRISEASIPANTGDFRLMDRRVVEELKRSTEHHGFLRGMVASVGFPQVAIPYHRDARYADAGKYNRIFGSTRIGLNGIFCFSSKPLQMLTGLGLLWSLVSALLCLIALALLIAGRGGLPGTALFVSLVTGIQLTALGLVGEYVTRIYDEVKGRPMYIVDAFDENQEALP